MRAFGISFASQNKTCVTGIGSANVGFKFKPDTFDGSVPLREFLTQFDLIARRNAWPDLIKTVALASSLRGKTRVVLDGIFEIKNLKFELRSRLELHYGEGYLAQTYVLNSRIGDKNLLKIWHLSIRILNECRDWHTLNVLRRFEIK